MTRFPELEAERSEPASEIDLRALSAALKRRRRAYLLPTLLAFLVVTVFVFVVPPRYTGQTQVLLENQETFFNRPDRVNTPPEVSQQVDQEGVASQVQLVTSTDIARRAIKQLGLVGNPEFDVAARTGPLTSILVLLGIVHDPMSDTVDARLVQAFLDKLVVFSPPKTRVITIQFTSKDATLAAHAANVVAELYIEEQSAAKRAMAKDAAEALATEIAGLRTKLADADAARERYRLQTGLLAGSNNMTLSGQQLADINSDLSKARSAQADSQAKASMIRELLRNGKATDIPDVINNDIVRRLWDQRSLAQAQLALESRTLLPGHPRIKELQAQVDQYDLALKAAARQAATALENEARIAGARVENLEAVLAQQKSAAGVSNVDEVHLRALERTAQSLKDQLESSTTKYQEALARQSSDATPADARIISRAQTPQDPSFPKKLPFILFGTVATLFFSVGFVIAGELLSGRATGVADARRFDDIVLPPAEDARPVWTRDTETPPQASPRRASDLLRSLSPARGAARIAASDTRAKPKSVAKPAPEPASRRSFAVPRLDRHWIVGSGPIASAKRRLVSMVNYLRDFGRSAAQARLAEAMSAPFDPSSSDHVGWDVETPKPAPRPVAEQPGQAETSHTHDVSPVVDRIVAAHVPGHGLHIVGTSLGDEVGTTTILVDLARHLSEKGRAVAVDLNRTSTKLAALCDGDGRTKIATMSGLAELLAGAASFAEVIYRDHASRLHFVPSGCQDADFRDFDLILDALSETYDFVLLLTPAFPESEIAKVMAPYADFVVLASVTETDDATLGRLEKELSDAGARHVLVAGAGRHAALAKNVA